jgi:citrate lyase subunit beta/citryl-CoA lyase
VKETRLPTPLPRSYLFVPGHRPQLFAKACAAGADAVIVDLEDAVAPGDKAGARTAIADWLTPEQPVIVRINGADTPWFADDLALCARPGIAGIVLPKAERVEDLARVAAQAADGVPLLPLIESAAGLWNVLALARAPRVQRLVFGSIDFRLDLDLRGEEDELLPFRSQLVLVSRVAGIGSPVDGVTVALDDEAVLRADSERGRRLGFGAKLCIHPRQAATVNACFSPTADEVAWATRVIAAAAGSGGAAVAVDGRMVDRPVVARAERILAEIARTPGKPVS